VRREPERGVDYDPDGLVLVGETKDRENRSEHLVLSDVGRVVHVCVDGRRDEVAVGKIPTQPLATGDDSSTALGRSVDHSKDAIAGRLVDHRPHNGRAIERVSDWDLSKHRRGRVHHRFIDRVLDKEPGGIDAALTRKLRHAPQEVRQGGFDVNVVEDDVGGLPSKLKPYRGSRRAVKPPPRYRWGRTDPRPARRTLPRAVARDAPHW
jgi:hypothetical protein